MGFQVYDEGISDQFFVCLRDSEELERGGSEELARIAHELAAQFKGSVLYSYSTVKSFSVRMGVEDARSLATDVRVEDVEQDTPILAPEDFDIRGARTGLALAVAGRPWGLDRIDQPNLPLNGSYNPPNTGKDVNVYVIDSGISDASDAIFHGRLLPGVSVFPKGDPSTQDCSNHGTGVAAVIGSRAFGVASEVSLIPVRVWCRGVGGSAASIAAGVEWVHINASRPAVANISIVVGASRCLGRIVKGLIRSGVTCVVAAGNSGREDVSRSSPANVEEAITVAASTATDKSWSGTSFGSLVDIFAPGELISSFSSQGVPHHDYSGTSLAAGFVSGAVAMFLHAQPGASPFDVWSRLFTYSTKGVIQNANNSPNCLLRV
jgi:subtilisin family serine protease